MSYVLKCCRIPVQFCGRRFYSDDNFWSQGYIRGFIKALLMTALIACCVSVLSRTLRVRWAQVTPVRRYVEGIQPFVKHRTLSYEDFRNRDILVIGDVHGCYDEAMSLIEMVKSQTMKKLVTIFVGDMVNKGPKNHEMLEFLMKEKDVYCVRGNHEQAVLRSSYGLRQGKSDGRIHPWYENLTAEQFEYLRNLPYTISIPLLNMIVVHAGISPDKPLHMQNDHDMLHMRSLVWVKDDFHGQVLVPMEKHVGDLWAHCWPGPQHIYFGHDAITKLQILPHCTGLDTGCLYGGKLTGVLLKIPENITAPILHYNLEREFFSVDAQKPYVPVG